MATWLQSEVSRGDLEQLESQELLEDNQRMAKLLADSEGDKKEVANLLERLSEERKNYQRKMKQFKEQGNLTHILMIGDIHNVQKLIFVIKLLILSGDCWVRMDLLKLGN